MVTVVWFLAVFAWGFAGGVWFMVWQNSRAMAEQTEFEPFLTKRPPGR